MRRILFLMTVLSICLWNVDLASAQSMMPTSRMPAAPPCDSAAPPSPSILQPDRSSRPPGPASFSIVPSTTDRVQAATVYSYTGSTIITPTIDGVFSGQFVDGDGITLPLSGTAGVKNPLSFVDEQLFDSADHVYWNDPTYPGNPMAFTSWQPTMTLWLDNNNDGVFQSGGIYTDAIIIGATIPSGTNSSSVTSFELNGLNSTSPFPASASPYGFSPFVYNDAEFIYDTPSKANNRYDIGEDIYYIGGFFTFGFPPAYFDRIGEFRGAQQALAPDPDNPLGPPIAHVYWTQDANYLYFHNDFLADSVAPYYDFEGMPYLAGNNGFIDSDGTTTAGPGIGSTDRIGIDPAARKWFTTTDQVAWYDADQDHHWTPSLDALWQDNGNSIYTSTVDSVIVYAAGTLTDGITATAVLDPSMYEFVYRDDNPSNNAWDNDEDIWALTGDQIWDYNYFDNKITWLIDGDGAATTGRGGDDPARVDGDQWFDAEDQVYFYDANGDSEWTDLVDALWKDNNGNGTYQSGTDTLIRSDSISVPTNTASGMALLQRSFVDGNGTQPGAGSDNTARTGQTAFQSADRVYWQDADSSDDWSSGDSLWIDNDTDGIYRTSISDTVIISAAGFVSGTTGTLLTPGAHWIGYDDGEVNYNGQYDSGEDISASNARFAYDDLEIDPNFKYDLGEDIYDRDYLEIWDYAEGDSTNTLLDNNDFAPDREPNNRDIGFRVHLNGIRVDNPSPITSTRVISDYDAPGGILAAAGWGPSRGFVGPMFPDVDPAFGGFNRHYEYRLPRHGGTVGVSVALKTSKPQTPVEKKTIEILPDCKVKTTYEWHDIKPNGRGGFQGKSGLVYGSSDGKVTVWTHQDHPEPKPPLPPPVKNDLSDPYYPGHRTVPLAPDVPFTPQSFFDVFTSNNLPVPTEILRLDLAGSDPLGTMKPVSVQTSDPHTQFNASFSGGIGSAFNIPDKGWVEVGVATVCCNPATANTLITNTVAATATTGTGTAPVPGSPASDSHLFSPTITLTLWKISTPITQVAPGGRVTYTIGYENRSPFPLSHIKFTDTMPVSITNRQSWPVDSFFDVFFEISPTIMLPGDRGQIKFSGNISPTVQTGTRLTNTITGTFYSPLIGTTDAIVRRRGLDVFGPPTTSTIPIELVALELKSVAPVNVSLRITTTVTPISATLPITFNWRAVGQTPLTTTGGLSSSIVFTWTTPGTKVITVTASNITSTKQVTGSILITAPSLIPIEIVALELKSVSPINVGVRVTTTVTPISVTQPITFDWRAVGQTPFTTTGGVSSSRVFTWTTPGTKVITVTVSNVTSTKQVTGSIFIYTPPTSVQITGPFTGTVKRNYTFTATINPASATLPITYVWQTSGHPPITSSGGLTSTATFSYLTYGLQQVFVTAYDFSGSSVATDQHNFTINYAVYLPIVLKSF
jgi:uncharacterized repeat protein (TIGR01451 family)